MAARINEVQMANAAQRMHAPAAPLEADRDVEAGHTRTSPLGRETPVRRIHAAVPAGGYRSPATLAMLEILKGVAADYRPHRPELALAG